MMRSVLVAVVLVMACAESPTGPADPPASVVLDSARLAGSLEVPTQTEAEEGGALCWWGLGSERCFYETEHQGWWYGCDVTLSADVNPPAWLTPSQAAENCAGRYYP